MENKELDSNKAPAETANSSEMKFGIDLDKNLTQAPELEKDYFTFNIQDIINAVNEHLEADESGEPQEAEVEAGAEPAPEAADEQETETEPAAESEAETEAEIKPEPAAESEAEIEAEIKPEPAAEAEPAAETEITPEAPQAAQRKKPGTDLIKALKSNDSKTKKLVLTDLILLAVIIASIIGGLIAANALIKEANAAKQEKITAVKENVKEVDLTESLRACAADEVLEQIQVPTYTLDELYALDLRKKTGFTEEDLKIITTRGLVGCEKAFVEAEEKYGVNSIFLISIASLESAYGTQMFRPNNMFGYGRTGFSSKSECIMTVASGLGNKYLNPGGSLYGGSPTLKGVNKRYAANPQWYYKVGKYMQRYYNELAAAKNGNLEKFE